MDFEGTKRRRLPGIKVLPNEILHHVFIQLNGLAPSESKLYNEPVFDLTSSTILDLKSTSLVCQRWRRLIIPILYKHARLIIHGPIIPQPIMRHEHFALLDFVRKNNLKSFIASFALCIRSIDFNHDIMSDRSHAYTDFSGFWNAVFEVMDPMDVKIVCSPQVLGALTRCRVNSYHYSSYDMPYHLLQLRQSLVPPPLEPPLPELRYQEDFEDKPKQVPLRISDLLEIRPWTFLLFNEGSFIKSYKLYDFHQKSPPTILDDLVGESEEGSQVAMVPATIRDFSYIGVFPNSNHFHKLTHNLPRLDRLYVQLVPRKGQLHDPELLDHLDPNDMWLERNSCYAYIMRELFSSPPLGNYLYLKEFESGDAADVDAWEMAVEYVKRAGGGWKVEKPGVFVKDIEEARKLKEAARFGAADEAQEQVPPLLLVPSDFV